MPACHYEVLGLELNCTEDEIKKAYRELSKKYHPDKNFGCTDAKERFQRINEAKIVLLDRKQRVTYDAKTYTEKLLKSIGADFNQQVQQWVELTMLTQADFKVDHVPIARQMTDILPNHFNLFMQQCGARFMSMHSPTQGVVLIGGNPAMIKRGKELIHNCMDELEGKRAPADGLIFIVPPQHQGKMPMMVANFAGWSWTYGTQIHQAPSDRLKVVIRGGSRWPAVVATLQQFVDFTGTILNTSGQTLDCWRFAHMCELCNIAGAIGHLLPPQWNPDKNTLRELFKYALQLDNAQQSKMSLFDLALRAVKQRPSCATVRAASSAAVYAEYNQLPTKQSAQLLLAFSQVQSSMSQAANFIQQRFVDQHLQTLQRLGPFLDCGDAMLLRSKGFIAAKEAVPDDSQWHRWDDVLRPDGRLAAFWKDLRKFFQQNERLAKPWGLGVPPAEWHTVPDVMCNVLKRCVQGTNLSVDLEKGIFRTKEPPPPAAPPPAPKTVAPPLPTGPSASAASGEATARAPVEEHLTLVEHAEDLMFELSSERKHDPAAYLDLEMVTQKLQKRLGQDASKISKDWYMKFEVSFAVQKVNSSVHSFVKLASPGRKRADVRDTERRRKAEQKEVFEVVKRVLPTMLKNEAPPTSMQEKESCALLALLSRETTERCKQDLPKNTLQKLCGGNVRTDELLRSTVPFSMAMVMQAVTALQKRSHHFEEKALVEILRAAALEMHDKDGPSGRLWAPLTVVRDAVLAACKEPFLGLFKRKKDTEAKLLPTSCALRICSELVMSGTEHLTNLCPPCLSESYGSFRVFAELCGALATLYGAVSIHLGPSGSPKEPEALMRLEEAFDKLANLCQKFCNCISSRDPRGLARLAYAFAKVGGDSKHKPNKLSAASKLGLAQVSKVIQSSDISKADGWDMTHLSEIACSYIHEPDKAVFRKIAEAAAALLADTPSMLKRETLMPFIMAFHQTGSMKELDAFLKWLKSSKWFKNYLSNQNEVKRMHSEDFVVLVAAMVHAEDFDALEDLEMCLKQVEIGKGRRTTYSCGKCDTTWSCSSKVPQNGECCNQAVLEDSEDKSCKDLIDMLKETNASSNPKAKSFGLILQQKIVDAFARSQRPPDLDSVLQLCTDERIRQRLIEVCSQGERLEKIPKPNTGNAWSSFRISLESSLAPFVRGKCRAPRLEAAYAGRIMHGLEQCGVFQSPPKRQSSSDFVTVKDILTAASHFSEDMFASMPALVQALIQGISNLPTPREDGEMLKTLVRKMLQVGKVAEKDDALTTWTSQIEDAILKAAAAGSGVYEMHWEGMELTILGKDFKQLHKEVKGALGTSWQSIILARSRRLSWIPGQPIQFHAPRPRAVLRDLAEKLGDLLGQRLKNEVLELKPEAAAQRAQRGELARSRSRDRENREVPKAKAKAKAKAAPRANLTVFGGTEVPLGQALEGEYYKDGMNHGKFIFKKIAEDPTGSVDAVFLYYWNGEDCQEDAGWWFGDKVGGTEAFMHNPLPGQGSQPPFNGWEKGVKIQPFAFGLGAVKGQGKGRAKPSARGGGPGGPGPRGPGGAPVPPAKRPREEDERHPALREWLNGLDEGRGGMLVYYEALKEQFDADLTQIAAARIEIDPKASPVEQVEPTFWEAVKCTKGMHRQLFARGIMKLPAA